MKPILALALVGACAPSQYPLPSNALRYATHTSDEDRVRVTLRPITESSWKDTPAATRLQWSESALYWPLRLRGRERDLLVPLVPLPSLEVIIENQSDQPLRFAQAEVTIEDSTGHRYSPASQSRQLVPRVLDRLLAVVPELWFLRKEWGPTDVWPALPNNHPWYGIIHALIEQVEEVPLFGPEVEVAPGGRFDGVIVLGVGAATPAELAERQRGQLHISWSGVRMGAALLEPRSFTLSLESRAESLVCSDGRQVKSPDECQRVDGYTEWSADGPCLQIGESIQSGRLRRAEHWIGGTRVTRADEERALLDVKESHGAAVKARALRLAGWLLIGGGAFAAAGIAAGIAGSGDYRDAPAGMSALALSGVGVLLHVLGQRREREAQRSFNRYAFRSGACAPPL